MSSKRESDSEHPQGHKKADSGDSHGDHQAHQVDEVARAHDHHSQNGSSKPVLYHSLFACSTRPVVVIHELGIQDKVEIKKVKMSEAKTEAYLAMNPHGTIPTMKLEDGTVILESGAIAMYLAEKYGGQDHALFGKPEHRAEILQWLWYSTSTLYTALLPAYYGKEEDKEKVKQKLCDTILPWLQSKLGDNNYFVGNEFSLADIFMTYDLSGVQYCGWLKEFPKLDAYTKRNMERPSYVAAYEPTPEDGAMSGASTETSEKTN